MTFDEPSKDFPSPDLALDVQRGEPPGAPGGVLFFDIKLIYIFISGIAEWIAIALFKYPAINFSVRFLLIIIY